MAQRLSDIVAEAPQIEDRKLVRLGDIAAMSPVQYDDEEEKVMFSPSFEGLIGVPDTLRQSYKAQGKIGAFEAFARNAKPWTFLPFGSSVDTGVESIAIMSAMNRLQANDYKEGDGMVQRNKDTLAINEYLRDKVEEQERGYSFGGQVVNVAKELPAVMVEFMATGGASVGGRMAARKGTEKLLSKVMEKSVTKIVARKAAGTVGSIATRTAMLGAVKIPAGTVKRMADDRVNLTDKGVKILDQGKTKPFTSLIKSVGDITFEVASEQSGGTIRKVAGAVLSPVQKAVAPAVARFASNKMVLAITKLTDKLKAGGLAKEMADKTKFDGILEEYGEERWGNFLRAASGVDDFGAGDNSNVMDRVIASVPSIEESLVELAAFSVPAGGQMALSYAENLKARVEAEPEVSDEIITQVADEIIAQQTAKTAEVVAPAVEAPAEVAAEPVAEQTPAQRFLAENPNGTAEEFVKSQNIVYHGSGTKFENFDDSMRGMITGAKSAKGAIWFTDSQKVAKAYSIHAAETGPVKKLLDEADAVERLAQKTGLKKYWDKHDDLLRQAEELDTYTKANERRKLADVKEVVLKDNLNLYEVDAKGKTPQELSDEGDIDSWLNEQIKEAKKLGKDGLVIKNLDDAVGLYNEPSTHYAIFDSKNIQTKSSLLSQFNEAKGKVAQKPAEDTEYDVAPVPMESIVNDEERYLAQGLANYLGMLDPGGQLEYSNDPRKPRTVVGRSSSARPTWWQNLGIAMPRTQMVLEKVARGEKLTDTQKRDYDILIKEAIANESYVLDTLKENRIYDRKRMDLEAAGASPEEVDEFSRIIGEAESAQEAGFTDQDFIDSINEPTADLPVVPELPQPPSEQPEGDKPRGLSVSIEADTIKEGLVKDLGDLPTYQVRNMEDIATRVSEFINDDYELAKRIALGEAPEQDGLRAQELYTGIRIKATMEGDVDTLRDLAMSEQATAMATELGQRIKALDAGVPEDPVTAIRNLKKSRTDALESKVGKNRIKKDIKDTTTTIKESTKKAAKKMDWAGFVASLEC